MHLDFRNMKSTEELVKAICHSYKSVGREPSYKEALEQDMQDVLLRIKELKGE